MALARKILSLAMLLIMLTGFRTYSNETRWNVSAASPKLFVSFCSTPAITTNDLPASDLNAGPSITFSAAVNSIFADFTNLPGSYVVLVNTSDPEYATSTGRTIEVCFKSQTGGGGVAQQKMGSDGKLSGCTIQLDPGLTSSAKAFVRTLSHELGHCLGLDHSQDNSNSLMSYFSDSSVIRLQMDDKMGLIQQFPADPAYANETATLGASCAPKD
ncbi:MAG: matrixin family metalloprotease [Bdellovibrionota bacterium]